MLSMGLKLPYRWFFHNFDYVFDRLRDDMAYFNLTSEKGSVCR